MVCCGGVTRSRREGGREEGGGRVEWICGSSERERESDEVAMTLFCRSADNVAKRMLI
jgi:hypothetical protein